VHWIWFIVVVAVVLVALVSRVRGDGTAV